MADSNSNDDLSGIEQMLRQLLGDEAAERMLEQMRQSGLDPQAITGGMNLPKDPTQIQHLIQSVTQLFSGSSEALDWDMVSQIAIQTSSTKPDPAPTAAQAARARDALSIADLWLDSVTVLTPEKQIGTHGRGPNGSDRHCQPGKSCACQLPPTPLTP